MIDWTEKDGRANASDKFNELSDFITRTILESGNTIVAGRVEVVSRLIVAQLAHVHGLAPMDPALELEMVERFKLLRTTLEAIGNGLPGAGEDELRTVAQGALLELADREVNWAPR